MKGTLLLTRSDLAALMNLDDYIEGIENAFRMHGLGQSFGTGMIHGDTPTDVEFHIKVGGLTLGEKKYFGLKINGSSFQNMQKYGLPNIMGAVVLFDAEKAIPLAIVDAGEPTVKRTGAATAVAAKYLAKTDSKVATICGCGTQGKIQLKSLLRVRELKKVFAYDMNFAHAQAYAEEMAALLKIEVIPTEDLKDAALQSDIIVTCTPTKQKYLMKDYISPGTFIAAVGADSPGKQELDENLLKGNKVVPDILAQCAKAGELQHGLSQKILTLEDVHGELGQIVCGNLPGRENDEEIIIYDATGTALQDTASAALCFEKASAKGMGQFLNFFE